MGDISFQNNLPDLLLSGKELPTFKFELEKSKGKVLGKSFGKEVTVEQLPISKGIAGVSMQLEPSVMRELHWRATAAEWAFIVKGRVRTTVIDLSAWVADNPVEVVAANFNKPASRFEKFQRKDVFISPNK
jgi:oxalate decarboxylase